MQVKGFRCKRLPLGAAARFAIALAAFSLPPYSAAGQSVVLKSTQLETVLDRSTGLPSEYRIAAAKASIRGADPVHRILVTVFTRKPYAFYDVPARLRNVEATATRADFQFAAEGLGKTAATFALRYELNGATVFVSLESVHEEPGFELIEVATPELATIREEDGPAWLAYGEQGGSTVALDHAKPAHTPQNRFWGGVAVTLPVAMVGTSKALCVQETLAYMNTTELEVEGEPGHRHASLGTKHVYRINGSLSQDMNMDPGNGRISGNENTPNLLVGQRPICRLDFTGDHDRNGVVDWLDGAKLVRARMPEIPSHYYDDKFQYYVHADQPAWPQPHSTFEQTREMVHQLANLTAHAPQVAYMWGWQYRGKDTGYPAVAQINPRLGTYDGLKALIADARTVGANVTFSDNYDDAYKSSPAWDQSMIARRPDGELWLSRNWTGENSYIIGLAKYMAGPGLDRVRYTCAQYPVKDSYLIDVLSYYPIRNDWDPAHPASGFQNLTEGRYKLLDEFKKCGLDIVSEQLRYAFIGRNSVNDNGPSGGETHFGGDPIPLAATIYRHSAIWGMSGSAWRAAPEIYSLFFNGHHFPAFPDSTVDQLAGVYFSALVPWFAVHYREVESYRREGDRTVIGLEGNSSIDIDWKANTYAVSVNGTEVARTGDTFCPIDNDRIAFYSKTGKHLSAPLPKNWNPSTAAAFALFADQAQPVAVSITNGKIVVAVPAARPIIYFRDGAAARKLLLANQ
jgi:Family of unknown function (DUF5696)